MDVLVKKIFLEIPRNITVVRYEQNHGKQMKYKHTVDTAVDYRPIEEMPIDIWFMCTVQVTRSVPTTPALYCQKWTTVTGYGFKNCERWR